MLFSNKCTGTSFSPVKTFLNSLSLPHLLNRIVEHKKALGATLFSGVARSHRGNPATAVNIEKIYGAPVLFSGLASLVLSRAEINILDQHYTTTLKKLLNAHKSTPNQFVLSL